MQKIYKLNENTYGISLKSFHSDKEFSQYIIKFLFNYSNNKLIRSKNPWIYFIFLSDDFEIIDEGVHKFNTNSSEELLTKEFKEILENLKNQVQEEKFIHMEIWKI